MYSAAFKNEIHFMRFRSWLIYQLAAGYYQTYFIKGEHHT